MLFINASSALAQAWAPTRLFEKVEQLTHGSPEAQLHLQRGVNEHLISRELASRMLILRNCLGRKVIVGSAQFDGFSEVLGKRLRNQSDSGLDPLNVREKLLIAMVANRMTGDQVTLVEEIAASPIYGSLLDLIGVERALNYLAGGLEDVNSGEKQSWIAMRVVDYLQINSHWPQMSKILDDSERIVVEASASSGLAARELPFDAFRFNELMAVAGKLLHAPMAGRGLSEDLLSLWDKYNKTDLPAVHISAMSTLALNGELAEMSICLRDKSSCISVNWFEHALSSLAKWNVAQYIVGESVLNNEFPGMCEPFKSSGK